MGMARLALVAGLAGCACFFNVALASKVTPIQKVVSMLTDLRTRVNDEGTTEAETYNSFACFCKTTMADKDTAISQGKTDKNVLESKISSDSSIRDKEDLSIDETLKKARLLDIEIAMAKSDRKQERLTHDQNEVDLTGAIRALDSALLSIKSAKTGVALAQLSPVVKGALGMAQALLSQRSQAMTSLLSEEKPSDPYSFQSGSVFKTLEGLKVDFVKKKDELNKAEASAQSTHNELVHNKNVAIKHASDALKTSKKEKAKATARIVEASSDLTNIAAKILDDQTYLADLASKCSEKAVLWDKRTQARANELTALSQAIVLIKTLSLESSPSGSSAAPEPAPVAAPDYNAVVPTLLQAAAEAHHTRFTAAEVHRLQVAAEASPALHQQALANAQHPSVSFVTQLGGRRARVMTILKRQAHSLHSSILDELVARASVDPLAKVKVMIKELVERLLKQATNEANHKGFCDKEYASAAKDRDGAADALTETNSLLELSEARRDKLGEEIDSLRGELKELESAVTESTKFRKEEKAENEKSLQDAGDGRKAVQDAMEVLARYYKTRANVAKSMLLQDGTGVSSMGQPGVPDAGFDGEYAGLQDGAVGVLGMLDVVKSDLERSIKETNEDEEMSKQAFYKFEKAAGMSRAAKSETLKASESAKSEADKEDLSNRGKLQKSQEILDASLREIASLDKACRLGGTTAEERKIQRDEEMSALSKALCILESGGGSC